jgi:hypothetical protein
LTPTLNAQPPTFADKFGPSSAVNGEAPGGLFAETYIHERVPTITADGYETTLFPLMRELGECPFWECFCGNQAWPRAALEFSIPNL